MSDDNNPMIHAAASSTTSYGDALERVTRLWRERPVPPRPIRIALVIHARNTEDAIAELEDVIARLRSDEYTEGRGGGRHVNFAWHLSEHHTPNRE